MYMYIYAYIVYSVCFIDYIMSFMQIYRYHSIPIHSVYSICMCIWYRYKCILRIYQEICSSVCSQVVWHRIIQSHNMLFPVALCCLSMLVLSTTMQHQHHSLLHIYLLHIAIWYICMCSAYTQWCSSDLNVQISQNRNEYFPTVVIGRQCQADADLNVLYLACGAKPQRRPRKNIFSSV